MKTIPLTVQIPTPDANGEPTLVAQEIQLVADNIFFTHKVPLQPTTQIAILSNAPLFTQNELPEATLAEAGLVKFETPEGSFSWVNVSKSLFYFSPDLGVYVIVFPGGTRVGVKSTTADMDKAFGKVSFTI